MRLLNALTLMLEEYFEGDAPPYAILSHRWSDGEVSFQDIQGPTPKHKAGFEKIRQTCLRALNDGLTHAWVDTCCIDKLSSAELSESINSMFRWYEKSAVCYAYLADVEKLQDDSDQVSAMACSEWFERGWTLQELLAPTKLVFFSSGWSLIGNREVFLDLIERRTGIDRHFLTFLDQNQGYSIYKASIAERMSWASKRRTTRIEDVAYCMLGIFGISMPLLYGEGETAFIRLQEELIRQLDDQTILAWDAKPEVQLQYSYRRGVLAESPAAFMNRGNLIPRRGNLQATTFSVTNKGVAIEGPLCVTTRYVLYLMLLCGPKDDPETLIALPLCDVGYSQYGRIATRPLEVNYSEWKAWRTRRINLLVRPVTPAQDRGFEYGGICIRHIPHGFQLIDASPPELWSTSSRIFNASISQGVTNPDRPPMNFVLRLVRDDYAPVCVQVSIVAVAPPRSITQRLGIESFRARCSAVSAQNLIRSTRTTKGLEVARLRARTPSYTLLPDRVLLYATTSRRRILNQEFLFVDIKTTRNYFEKGGVLLRDSFDPFISLLSHGITESRLGVTFFFLITFLVGLRLVLGPEIHAGLESFFDRLFSTFYAVFAKKEHIATLIRFVLIGALRLYSPPQCHFVIPRRFSLSYLGICAVNPYLKERMVWYKSIGDLLPHLVLASVSLWAEERNNALREDYQRQWSGREFFCHMMFLSVLAAFLSMWSVRFLLEVSLCFTHRFLFQNGL